jgi:hypothetical protein
MTLNTYNIQSIILVLYSGIISCPKRKSSWTMELFFWWELFPFWAIAELKLPNKSWEVELLSPSRNSWLSEFNISPIITSSSVFGCYCFVPARLPEEFLVEVGAVAINGNSWFPNKFASFDDILFPCKVVPLILIFRFVL